MSDVIIRQVTECCYIVDTAGPMDGAELTTLRTRLSLRQQDVGALLGVSAATVGQWERNERAIPASTAARARDVLREAKGNGCRR
jgi:DNA-binding transcriptional regulator YiaG